MRGWRNRSFTSVSDNSKVFFFTIYNNFVYCPTTQALDSVGQLVYIGSFYFTNEIEAEDCRSEECK